jgi:hypothetical protein
MNELMYRWDFAGKMDSIKRKVTKSDENSQKLLASKQTIEEQ